MDNTQSLEGKPPVDYRKAQGLNFSRIKDFYKLGLYNYYKKYILGMEVEDKESAAMVIGSAVDCILFEGEEHFENTFHIGDNTKIPSGKGGEFGRELFRQTQEGVSFDLAFKNAYEKAEMSPKLFDSFVGKFQGSEIEAYFQSMVDGLGKTSISLGDAGAAKNIVETLRHHSRTRQIFEMDGYSQLPLFFDYNGHKMKCKLDKLLVDKANRMLRPIDLKVFYSVDDFEYRYLKDLYYLQEAVYMKGVEDFRDKHYPDWGIDDFKFCVGHSANLSLPVIYDLRIADGEGDLYEGFKVKSGRRYKGLDEMLFEISWHEENDIWNTTWENHTNKGKIVKTL